MMGDPRIDGAASIAIGLVLAVVAALLAREAKGLLIGESADPALVARLREAIEARPEITAVNHVRTIHTAPQPIFVAISADFADGLTMGEGERADRGDGGAAEGDLAGASARSTSARKRRRTRYGWTPPSLVDDGRLSGLSAQPRHLARRPLRLRRKADRRRDVVASVGLDQQAPFRHVRLVERLAEIEHRGEGDILVGEPFDPFGAGAGREGLAQECDQRLLLARLGLGVGQQVEPPERIEQVRART